MSTLLTPEDLAAMRSRGGRRLIVILGIATLVIGVVTLLVSHNGGRLDGPPLMGKVTVVDGAGTPVANRLTVLFVDGQEVGRTDLSGQLHGVLPKSVRAISPSLSLREGEIQTESYPPDAPAFAYAFPGDARALPADITTCSGLRLPKTGAGAIRCPDFQEDVPTIGAWLMGLFVSLILFPMATIATRHVAPWPREWPRPMQYYASYLTGAVLSAVVVVMFATTGVFAEWMYRLTDIFRGAVNGIIAALGVVIGILMFYTWVRGHLIPPRP